MQDTTQKTLERIRKEHIRPEPQWRHWIATRTVWTALGIILLSGALLLAVLSTVILDLDWDLYQPLRQAAFQYRLSLFPFWLATACLALLAGAVLGLRKTENGYRYRLTMVVALPVLTAIVAGSVFWSIGFGRQANDSLLRYSSFYRHHTVTKEALWSRPEQGLLSGTILTEESDDTFILHDLGGNSWDVRTSPDTVVRPSTDLRPGNMIKIIGKQEDARTFSAKEIRPWQGGGMMRGQDRRQDQ